MVLTRSQRAAATRQMVVPLHDTVTQYILNRSTSTDANLAEAPSTARDVLVMAGPGYEELFDGYWICGGITDVGVCALAARCPLLQRLSLTFCRFITSDALTVLARHCPLLEYIDLAGDENITDSGVIALARGCSRLQHVSLNNCVYVTGDAVVELAQRCPDLRYLNLCACNDRITDKTAYAIADNCHALQHVEFGGCPTGVTDDGITRIAERCMHLTVLTVSSGMRISEQCLARIAKLRPLLKAGCEVAIDDLIHPDDAWADAAFDAANEADGYVVSEDM